MTKADSSVLDLIAPQAQLTLQVEFYCDKHLCQIKPTLPEVAFSNAALYEDMTSYLTMYGACEFSANGTL